MGNPFIEWSRLKRIGLFGLLRLNWNLLCDVIVWLTPLDGQSVVYWSRLTRIGLFNLCWLEVYSII